MWLRYASRRAPFSSLPTTTTITRSIAFAQPHRFDRSLYSNGRILNAISRYHINNNSRSSSSAVKPFLAREPAQFFSTTTTTTAVDTNNSNITENQQVAAISKTMPWLDAILEDFYNQQQVVSHEVQHTHSHQWKAHLVTLLLKGWQQDNQSLTPEDVVHHVRNFMSSHKSSLLLLFNFENHDDNEWYDVLLETLVFLKPQYQPAPPQSLIYEMVRPIVAELGKGNCAWNGLLQAWATSGRMDAPERVIYLRSKHYQQSWWNDESWYWYFTALAQTDHQDYGPSYAEDVLFPNNANTDNAIQLPPPSPPNPEWLYAILLGWIRQFELQPKVAPKRARALQRRLVNLRDVAMDHHHFQRTKEDGGTDPAEDEEKRLMLGRRYYQSYRDTIRRSYEDLIHAHTQQKQQILIDIAERLIRNQCHQYQDSIAKQQQTYNVVVVPWPSTTSVYHVIYGMCHYALSPKTVRRAQDLLQDLKDAMVTHHDQQQQQQAPQHDALELALWSPKTSLYNVVLGGWAQFKKPVEAESLLRQMVAQSMQEQPKDQDQQQQQYVSHLENDSSDTTATTVAANDDDATDMLVNSGVSSSVLKVATTSDTQATRKRLEMCQPDDGSLSMVLHAWLRSGRIDAAQRAQDLWNEMTQPPVNIKPDHRTYRRLMKVWAGSKRVDAGTQVQQIFEDWVAQSYNKPSTKQLRLPPPEAEDYMSLLTAWAKGGYGEQAEQVVALIEQRGIPVTSDAFHLLMMAWFRSGLPESPDRAQRVVDEAMRRFHEDSNTALKIDLMANLIQVWGRSGRFETITRCQEIFQEVLDGYYDAMPEPPSEQQQASDDLRPLYNAFLYSITRQRYVEDAETLLMNMCNGQDNVTPDIQSFNTVLAGWARSPLPESSERAESLLRKCQLYYRYHAPNTIPKESGTRKIIYGKKAMPTTSVAGPDTMSYNLTMKAWVHNDSLYPGDKALQKVECLYQEMKNNGIPVNQTTYKYYLAAMVRAEVPNLPERVQHVMKEMEMHRLIPGDNVKRLLEPRSTSYPHMTAVETFINNTNNEIEGGDEGNHEEGKRSFWPDY